MALAVLKMDEDGIESFADELKPGAKLLHGQFTIESFLNAGGFGITYLAQDSLYRRIVIKECFPSSFCRRHNSTVVPRSRQRQEEFRSVVELFMQEALNLSKLAHPNIVKVHQVFRDNETAYMAMDHIHGPDLLETIEGTAPKLSRDQIIVILRKMLDALGYVHAQGFLHRDISPDNILLDRTTDEPVLIDFGAARKDVTRKSRALSGLRVVKDGYSPQEFYISGSAQAPCSDLYALAATFCHLISGELPKTSQERLSAIANREGDPQVPLSGRIKGYPASFLAAVDKAMSVFPRDRIQSVAEWQAMLRDVKLGAPAAMVVPASGPVAPAVPPQAPTARGPRDWLVSSAAAVLLLAGLSSLAGDLLDRFGAGRTVSDADVAVTSVAAPILQASASPFGLVRVVQEPFVQDPASAGRVAARLPWSPSWIEPGQWIVEVNGAPVQDSATLVGMMAEGVDLGQVTELKVIFGYQTAPGGDIIRKMATLPVVDRLSVEGGLVFEMQRTPTGVRTVVASLPENARTDLQVGDILLVYTKTGETIGTTTALADILQREMTDRVATYGFAVQRAGQMAVGSFQLPVAG
ncbi:MAG: serine/threonine protein kinase [Rhodobacter sp.]|nr:serine/threonine protein kinase [Rhodobacter sp.]